MVQREKLLTKVTGINPEQFVEHLSSPWDAWNHTVGCDEVILPYGFRVYLSQHYPIRISQCNLKFSNSCIKKVKRNKFFLMMFYLTQ